MFLLVMLSLPVPTSHPVDANANVMPTGADARVSVDILPAGTGANVSLPVLLKTFPLFLLLMDYIPHG
ncbi:hypothetical protein PanWU01x14_146100 [Parasponia andersonii]|uniref:Transmembrane protein n=1 Tax=Parasponia andersonii TaxID=3476 RepID=A0A2P5CKC8_PARAD|nr:hypothetical protein PanWU01x14_146100 [Parasponia andersonii]